MFHYFDRVETDRGDALEGWQIELVDSVDDETVIAIFADENSTPISTVSGIENRTVSDVLGNFSLFVPDGTYNLRFYNDLGEFQRTIRFVPMFANIIDASLIPTIEAFAVSAEQDADRAETAAAISGTLYASIAAGLAATSDGDEFGVNNGDGTATVYRNSSGSEVSQRTIIIAPSNAGSAALIGTTGGSNVQADIDALEAATGTVTVRSGGVDVSTAASILNFTGQAVATEPTAGTAEINVTSQARIVQGEAVEVSSDATIVNYTGDGVTVTEPVEGTVNVAIPGGVLEPDATDHPSSLYVGDSAFDSLLLPGLGHNVTVGRLIAPNMSGIGFGGNTNTAYGMTMIGTRIGEPYMVNPRDAVLVGYENNLYAGDLVNIISIGAKSLYGDRSRVDVASARNQAPQNGIAIGVTSHFDGLTATSAGFVTIGTNAGRDQTRAFETVYIGEESGRYLGATLYNVAVGANTLGGETDQSATNTINNVAIGWYSLGAQGNGTQNVAVGGNTGRGVTTGGRNILIGHGAGSDVATANAAAGANAITTGSYNILLGDDTNASGATAQYQVAIGADAVTTKDNQFVFGRTAVVNEFVFNGYAKTNVTTVAALPNASSVAGAGARMFVSDSSVAASGNFGAAVAAGGANTVPVYSDGTSWRIG